MTEQREVECSEHGQAYATFVCRHLIEGSNAEWYSGEPDDQNRWPDAWCGQCNMAFEAEGEWNEASEEAIGKKTVQLLCHHCYERIRSKCAVHRVE